jgi:hypothetical protein
VIAREAVLNNSDVVRLLRDRFVCIAIDNVDHPQLTPREREFLKDKGLKFCTQGMSAFTAGGKVLEMGGGFEAKGVLPMLKRALDKYKPEEQVDIPEPTADELGKIKRPPQGGLVCYVTWKALGDYRAEGSPTTGNNHYAEVYQRTLGVDRLWVRKDEADALAHGELADTLKKRLVPHLNYVIAGDVKSLELRISEGRLAGAFHTDTGDSGRLFGFIETKDGHVTRFDLLATGLGEQKIDCGFSARLTVVPKGKKVPVALLFTLADLADDLSRVVPARANDERYLK